MNIELSAVRYFRPKYNGYTLCQVRVYKKKHTHTHTSHAESLNIHAWGAKSNKNVLLPRFYLARRHSTSNLCEFGDGTRVGIAGSRFQRFSQWQIDRSNDRYIDCRRLRPESEFAWRALQLHACISDAPAGRLVYAGSLPYDASESTRIRAASFSASARQSTLLCTRFDPQNAVDITFFPIKSGAPSQSHCTADGCSFTAVDCQQPEWRYTKRPIDVCLLHREQKLRREMVECSFGGHQWHVFSLYWYKEIFFSHESNCLFCQHSGKSRI